MTAKGRVFIGNDGSEFGIRGSVSAYDVDTGDFAGRFLPYPATPITGSWP
jgi:quinohemoprotein ethanol dehydrogenase